MRTRTLPLALLAVCVIGFATLRGQDEIVVIGRRGGPDILDSEVARLAHLSGLSLTIAAGAD